MRVRLFFIAIDIKLLRIELFSVERKDYQVQKTFYISVFNGKHADNWLVGPLQNSNEIFISKSSSDGTDLMRFGRKKRVRFPPKKSEINDFQIKITDDQVWNFKSV